MTKWLHRITNVDLETKTADCSHCGRVKVRYTGSWRCVNAITEYRRIKREANRPEVCSVCGGTNKICYDHSHTSGKFRGWLCNNCNVALGMAYDNPETLRKLADYLEHGVK